MHSVRGLDFFRKPNCFLDLRALQRDYFVPFLGSIFPFSGDECAKSSMYT